MNRIYLLLLSLVLCGTAFAQVFTYGNNSVSKEEFLKAYNKNRNAVKDTQQSLASYLDLYIKFKLKVKGARDLHLDTSHSIQADTKNFRTQIEPAYLNNDSVVNSMVDEAFQRQQKDIHLVHYYVYYPDKISPEDSLAAYNAIRHAYNALIAAKQKKEYPHIMEDINTTHGNYYPVRTGDLGYVSAFSLPYQFENIAYNLKPGEVSNLMRTKSGWHFFINAGERKAIGKWKVAQIFFVIPTGSLVSTISAIEQKADSVYQLLAHGADFTELAKKYSQDRSTYMTGGKMPEFGTGKYDTVFENEVFSLHTDSSFTKPFRMSDGFHIVQRLGQTAIPSTANLDYLATLKQQVLRDARNEVAKAKFLEALSAETKYKRNTAISDSALIRYANNSLVNNGAPFIAPGGNEAAIFSYTKSSNNVGDWLKYVASQSASMHGKVLVVNKSLLDQYISAATLQYYKEHLEDYNTDFKYQVQEFLEGSLLFEVMQREVWDKAATDSVGLIKYYNAHKEKYTWNTSADLILFNCADSFAVKDIENGLQAGKSWRMIAKESMGRIQADSNRYEISQVHVPPGIQFIEGNLSSPLINIDNTASVAETIKLYPAGQQRSFAEAKGLVINDYQAYLEAQWLAQLQKKYPVKINQKLVDELLK